MMKFISLLLPWSLRRWVLNKHFGYQIHPTAKIGLAWVFPGKLVMAEHTRIDHFTVAIHIDKIELGANSTIGRGNWITGLTTTGTSLHFKHQTDRRAELKVGTSSSITKNHHIDCTNIITIGNFSTIAGYQSQLLTHSINIMDNRQDSAPINIGDYTFVGTNVVILGGATLPNRSVLGAKSLLNKTFSDEYTLYGGVPAKAIAPISPDAKYFNRADGFVI